MDPLPDLYFTEKSISVTLEALASFAKPEFNGIFVEFASSEKILKSVELSEIGKYSNRLNKIFSLNTIREDICEAIEIYQKDVGGFIKSLETLGFLAHTARDAIALRTGPVGAAYVAVSEMVEDGIVIIIDKTVNFMVDYKDSTLAPYYTAAHAGQQYNYSQSSILSEMLWASASDREIEEKINEFVVGNQEYLKILPELRQEIIDMGTHWQAGGKFVPFWGSEDLLKTIDDTIDWIKKYGTYARLKDFVAMQKPRLLEMRKQQLDAAQKEWDKIIYQANSNINNNQSSDGYHKLTIIKEEIGHISVIELKSDLTEHIQECDSEKDICTFDFKDGAHVILMPLFEKSGFRKTTCKDGGSNINLLPTRYNYCHLLMRRDHTLNLSFSGSESRSEKDMYVTIDPLFHLPEKYTNGIAQHPNGGAIEAKYANYKYNPGFGFSLPFNMPKNLADATFEAIPNKGWSFVRWYGDCSGNSTICTLPMSSDNSRITALFVQTDQIIENENKGAEETEIKNQNLDIQIIGKGRVFFDPYVADGIGNPISGIYKIQTEGNPSDSPLNFYVDKNSKIMLTARAQPYWKFTGWDGACAHANSQNTCAVIMDKAKSVSALFSPDDGEAEPSTKIPSQDNDPIKLGDGCQARDFSVMEERVQDAYIAYYGRPADVGGLAYWSKELQSAEGNIYAIMNDFADVNSEEYRERFLGKDDSELLENLYHQLFNRSIDAEGFIWYLNEMIQDSFRLGSLAISLVDGVSQDSSDWAELEARRKLARHYVTIMEAIPGGDTNVRLASYQGMLRGMENVNLVCDALSQAVFPAFH